MLSERNIQILCMEKFCTRGKFHKILNFFYTPILVLSVAKNRKVPVVFHRGRPENESKDPKSLRKMYEC